MASAGYQVRDLQSTVARLEGRDAEAAKAAEVLKARVTLLEGSVRLLQGTQRCIAPQHACRQPAATDHVQASVLLAAADLIQLQQPYVRLVTTVHCRCSGGASNNCMIVAAGDLASQSLGAPRVSSAARAMQQQASAVRSQLAELTGGTEHASAAETSESSGRPAQGQQEDARDRLGSSMGTPQLPTHAQSIWPAFRPAMVLRGASVLASPLPEHVTASPRQQVQLPGAPQKGADAAETATSAVQHFSQAGAVAADSSRAPWDPVSSNELSTAQLVAEIEAHFHHAQQLLQRHRTPALSSHTHLSARA